MKLRYYPGCTLKTTAKNFELPALAAMKELGFELVELPRWNCCGTVHSLASDDLMHHLAPVRVLIRVRDTGAESVVTLCAMCYNTLKQANRVLLDNPDKKERINNFLDTEEDYHGDATVLHLLEFLRDELGFDELKEKVTRPLEGLKLAPYYGCLLLRPEGIGIDDPESPRVMEDLTRALGGEAVDSPYKIECCGSYHTVDDVAPVVERTRMIISASASRGADAMVVGCPLCFFNLDYRQKNVVEKYREFSSMPVLYFTQLLALALEVDGDVYHFEDHYIDPRPLLQSKDLLKPETNRK